MGTTGNGFIYAATPAWHASPQYGLSVNVIQGVHIKLFNANIDGTTADIYMYDDGMSRTDSFVQTTGEFAITDTLVYDFTTPCLADMGGTSDVVVTLDIDFNDVTDNTRYNYITKVVLRFGLWGEVVAVNPIPSRIRRNSIAPYWTLANRKNATAPYRPYTGSTPGLLVTVQQMARVSSTSNSYTMLSFDDRMIPIETVDDCTVVLKWKSWRDDGLKSQAMDVVSVTSPNGDILDYWEEGLGRQMRQGVEQMVLRFPNATYGDSVYMDVAGSDDVYIRKTFYNLVGSTAVRDYRVKVVSEIPAIRPNQRGNIDITVEVVREEVAW